MLRLAHRILTQRKLPLYTAYRAETVAECKPYEEMFAEAQAALKSRPPVIVADNIAQYWNQNAHADKLPDWKDLPPCPPPFPIFFIEWNWPAIVYDEDGTPLTANDTQTTQAGMILVATAASPECYEWLRGKFSEALLIQTKWTVQGLLFSTVLDGGILLSHRVGILLDSEGKWLTHYAESCTCNQGGGSVFAIVLLTLGFMQCKNVQRIDVTSKEGPPPKWCRRQKVSELKYHALQIDPNIGARPRADERKTEGDRSGKALHICRGHFAHFRDDGISRGLFGRRRFGTFWIPAHTRGSLEHGRVVSTYNVKTPA